MEMDKQILVHQQEIIQLVLDLVHTLKLNQFPVLEEIMIFHHSFLNNLDQGLISGSMEKLKSSLQSHKEIEVQILEMNVQFQMKL